jgi:hypothetical protein
MMQVAANAAMPNATFMRFILIDSFSESPIPHELPDLPGANAGRNL